MVLETRILMLLLVSLCPTVSAGRRHNAGADRVEKIDLTPSQIIVVTSKNGPIESLSVEIDIVDIVTGEKSTAYNLRGSMLLITRGRYTISFLKPGHWYGIVYRSSQTINNVIYNEFKQQLLRTLDVNSKQVPFPVKVFDHRDQDNGKSLETLVVSSMWMEPPMERRHIQQASSEIMFDCSNEEKKFDLRLLENQTKHSVDVELENSIELMERNENARIVVGKITPKYCRRICWRTRLIANSAGLTFGTDSEKQCHALEPVTAETTLRDYLSYDTEHGNLTVFTDYRNATENDYAVVTIEVNELKKSKRPLVARDSFRTISEAQEFVLPALKANNFYAATYSYRKTSPFQYSEDHQFIIEVGERNKTLAENPPVSVEFSIANISGTLTPIAKLVVNPEFNLSRVEVTTNGFCMDDFAQNITLDGQSKSTHVLDINLAEAICNQDSRRPFCDPSQQQHNTNTTSSKGGGCSTELCYGLIVHYNGSAHELHERCVDAAPSFPIEMRKQSSLNKICGFLLSMIIVLNLF